MSEKYVNIKKIVIPFLSVVMLVYQATGVAALTQEDLAEISRSNPSVVVEYVETSKERVYSTEATDKLLSKKLGATIPADKLKELVENANPIEAGAVRANSVYASASTGFTDVSSNAYYAEAIRWAIENGITYGMGDGTFGVGQTVTRGQAVTFLWRSAGEKEPTTKVNPFTDVKGSDYFYKAVLWAKENGITTGTDVDKFSPEDPVTRGQLITFLYRTKGGETQSGANWYTAAEQWASNNGLLKGTAKAYSTNGDCPREDVVYYLWREMQSTSDQGQQQQQQATNVGKNAHEVPGTVDPEDGHTYTYTHNPAYDDGRGGSYDAFIDQLYAQNNGKFSKAQLRDIHPDVTQGEGGYGDQDVGDWGQG